MTAEFRPRFYEWDDVDGYMGSLESENARLRKALETIVVTTERVTGIPVGHKLIGCNQVARKALAPPSGEGKK